MTTTSQAMHDPTAAAAFAGQRGAPEPETLTGELAASVQRIVGALAPHPNGLSLAGLRDEAQLRSPGPGNLRAAIDAALRTKAIRRIGAHHSLRYVANGAV